MAVLGRDSGTAIRCRWGCFDEAWKITLPNEGYVYLLCIVIS